MERYQRVKRYLHQRFSLPPRFRQRLLHQGETLFDMAKIDALMDLQLVLLPIIKDAKRGRASVIEAQPSRCIFGQATRRGLLHGPC